MHRWTVGCKRPDRVCGLYLRVLLWLGGVSGACGGVGASDEPSGLSDCAKHERTTRNYDYMEGGDVRIRRLYSSTQWFLTVDDSGNVNGTQDPSNGYSILEIRTVSEGGVLAIKGVKSQHYISMSRSGVLQGKKEYNDSCNFRELYLENHYMAYMSEKWTKSGKGMFISLSQKGRPLRGKKTRKENSACHFIPRTCKEDDRTLA
ncbi:fibroblast growth factor 7 [Trichomycterus rosablanca]|uniref:fibroblast growth factor 7 n=1 Tax=Trichomycterus rosablanca TaxID=2290929 RepID=UPI002F3606DB